MPNATGRYYGDFNYDATVAAYNRADQTTWKLDHEFFPWLRMAGSYLHYGSREPSNAWWGGVSTPGQGVLYRKVDATQVNATIIPEAARKLLERLNERLGYAQRAAE